MWAIKANNRWAKALCTPATHSRLPSRSQYPPHHHLQLQFQLHLHLQFPVQVQLLLQLQIPAPATATATALLWSQLVRHHSINVAPVPRTRTLPHDLGLSKYLAYVPITWFSDSLPSIKTTTTTTTTVSKSGKMRMLMVLMMIGDGDGDGDGNGKVHLRWDAMCSAASLWSALLEW